MSEPQSSSQQSSSSSSSSWLEIEKTSHFSLSNIPFGIMSTTSNPTPRPATRIGNLVLDLTLFTEGNGFRNLEIIKPHFHVFTSSSSSSSSTTLNAFAALGRQTHDLVRGYIRQVLHINTPFPDILRDKSDLRAKVLIPMAAVTMHLPMTIGDYTDFYAGAHHAYNVGVLFRGPQNALQPNYCHMPIGYHGRASSVVVSGTEIRRPWGQILDPSGTTSDRAATTKKPVFSPSRKLDFELELGCFVARSSDLGTSVAIEDAAEYIFGYVLLNDWSARDIQAWEYVPLGPFNGKNFATTISPWVVLAGAFEEARCPPLGLGQVGNSQLLLEEVELLPYLRQARADTALNVELEVALVSGSPGAVKSGATEVHSRKEHIIARTNASNLMYSFEQMLAHHAAGGCNARTGDLLGSGTISGASFPSTSLEEETVLPSRYGSLLELTRNGKVPVGLPGADSKRNFLEDYDEVVMRGFTVSIAGELIGFGDCRGVILPARNLHKPNRDLVS